MFNFITIWGEYIWASVAASSTTAIQTLPVGLLYFRGEYGVEWGPFAAAITIIILPLLAVFIYLQRYFIQGLDGGSREGIISGGVAAMYLALRNQAVLRRSVVDTMRLFKAMGYGGIELELVRGLTDVLALDYLDDFFIEKVNEVSQELSFPVTAVSCHQNYVTDDFTFETTKRLIRTAPKYHTDLVIVSTAISDYEKEKHPELYDVLDIRTKELCNVAEEAGVRFTIEIEPHQLLNNLKSFFRVAEKVKSPNFKLNFDIGHVFLSEGGNLFKAIDDAKEFIVYSMLRI